MGAVAERLTEKDYDEALYVLNTSFSREGAPAEFREKCRKYNYPYTRVPAEP